VAHSLSPACPPLRTCACRCLAALVDAVPFAPIRPSAVDSCRACGSAAHGDGLGGVCRRAADHRPSRGRRRSAQRDACGTSGRGGSAAAVVRYVCRSYPRGASCSARLHCAPTRLAVARGRGCLPRPAAQTSHVAWLFCVGLSRLAHRVMRGMRPLRCALQRSGTACCAALWCAQCTAVQPTARGRSRSCAVWPRRKQRASRSSRPSCAGAMRHSPVRRTLQCCALHVA
jgi:hypothetical protein